MGYLEDLKKRLGEANAPPSPPSNSANETQSDNSNIQKNLNEAEKVSKQSPLPELITPPAEKQFFLSQTLIKAITNRNGYYHEDLCGRKIYEEYIIKRARRVTAPMLEGIYAETKMLGSGARGQSVTDLPRNVRTGEKKKAQRSIEEQTHRFPIWCAEKGINIIPGVNTQVPIVKRFDKKVLIRSEIDIFPTPFLHEDSYKLAIIDLKMTKDINSTFGDYCWGAPEFMDHLQADMYYWLVQDFDMDLNIKFNPEKEEVYRMIFENKSIVKMIEQEDVMFIYFVIGYLKEPLEQQKEFIHRTYRDPSGTLFRQKEWQERARKTLAQLSEWREQGWPENPSSKCKSCPAAKFNGGTCEKAINLKTI